MTLYPYQERVKDYLHTGKNVILQAPTGAGKTRAALAPFIESFFDFPPERFPHKCIYAVPMRVLANQFVIEYQELTAKYKRKHRRQSDLTVRIQTGEHRRDARFEGDLIFATIDQVLSSFLLAPYSLPRRLSNFNAGAITGAYLVFDEFHLFDPGSTLPTTLEMLKMLDGVAPFLLMTATFSSAMLSGLAQSLNAVIVPEDETARAAMQSLASQQKIRRYHAVDEVLTAEAIIAAHTTRSLVVCNVVDRARVLYEALCQHPELGDTQVQLLHSRFLQADRQGKEEQIRDVFHRENVIGSQIVVATQVIEVGLDITSQALHTELAPANAVLQRAGRCARYAGETGTVYVYATALNTDGETVDLIGQAWPYQDQRDVVQLTWQTLQGVSGKAITFSDEQALISQTHGDKDRAIVSGLIGRQESHQRCMHKVMRGEQDEHAAALIRAVTALQVVVHDEPNTVARRPFAAESFSLHPGTVRGQVKRWREAGVLRGGAVQKLQDQGDKDENGRSVYTWESVEHESELRGAVLVLLSPQLVGYDPALGLLLDRATGYRAALAPLSDRAPRDVYSYCLESYFDHVQQVHTTFVGEVWPELLPAAARLERVFGWSEGIITQAAHLVVLWHDVGKLNQPWQQWVQVYQDKIARPAPPGFFAHTDYDPGNARHHAIQRSMPRRPSHAAEGATAVAPLLAGVLGDCRPVFNAAFTAIARHHGAFTHSGQPYRLVTGAAQALAETLALGSEELQRGVDVHALWTAENPSAGKVRDFLADPSDEAAFLAYILLARALRRADQLGTKLGSSNF